MSQICRAHDVEQQDFVLSLAVGSLATSRSDQSHLDIGTEGFVVVRAQPLVEVACTLEFERLLGMCIFLSLQCFAELLEGVP